MSETTYNGWSNYETWCVNLHLTNDAARCELCRGLARDSRREAADCEQVQDSIWTIAEAGRFRLADALREFIEAQNPLTEEPSLFADLITSALSEVNWQEVAESLLEDG